MMGELEQVKCIEAGGFTHIQYFLMAHAVRDPQIRRDNIKDVRLLLLSQVSQELLSMLKASRLLPLLTRKIHELTCYRGVAIACARSSKPEAIRTPPTKYERPQPVFLYGLYANNLFSLFAHLCAEYCLHPSLTLATDRSGKLKAPPRSPPKLIRVT